MNVIYLSTLVRFAIAMAGALNIYLGYQLFCSVPAHPVLTGYGRLRTITSLGSGALLALFGTAVLIADAGAFRTGAHDQATRIPASRIQRKAPGSCGSSVDPEACTHKAVPLRTI